MNTVPKELAAVLSEETRLEQDYLPIGIASDINRYLPQSVTYQRFTARYAKFSATHPTPDLLVGAPDHTREFIEWARLSGDEDLCKGAAVWVISRIWARKREARAVFTPGVLDDLLKAEKAREQRAELHKAIARLVKNAPEDSFACSPAAALWCRSLTTGHPPAARRRR